MLPTPAPSPSASPPVIETVRVTTGSPQTLHRLPIPSSYLDGRRIRLLPAVTGDELMRQLPGADRDRSNSAFTNYGQVRVSFGGAGTDRGLLMVDGIPAQDGFGGQVDWAAYPAADVARAELMRGPGSALYGAGAIGGVLSLQTFSWSGSRIAAPAISAAAGSHYSSSFAVDDGTELGTRASVSFGAAQQSMSYRDLPPGFSTSIDAPAESTQRMAGFGIAYRTSPITTLSYGFRGAWDSQQEGRPNYEFARSLWEQRLSVEHRSGRATLTGTVFVRHGVVTNVADKISSPGALLYTQYVPTHESGATIDWRAGGDRAAFDAVLSGRFIGGVSSQYNAAGSLTAMGSGVQRIGNAALQQSWQFARGEAIAGIDATVVSVPEAEITASSVTTPVEPSSRRVVAPRVAGRFDLSPSLAFRASAGGGFRAPYLNELVRGYVVGPIAFLPNPLLVPERSASFVAGFDWQRGGTEASLDYTHIAVHDAIAFETIDATHQIRANIQQTATNGVTADVRRSVGPCASAELWGTAQNPRVVTGTPAQTGKMLPYVPAASAGVNYNVTRATVSYGASVSYLGVTYADDLNLQPLGTAVVVGLHANVHLTDGADVFVSADNATGARYLSSIDRLAPPAVVTIGLRVPLRTSSAGACGAP